MLTANQSVYRPRVDQDELRVIGERYARMCRNAGYIPTITQFSPEPFAMRNTVDIIEVRPVLVRG